MKKEMPDIRATLVEKKVKKNHFSSATIPSQEVRNNSLIFHQ
jgi:hypothetical protein